MSRTPRLARGIIDPVTGALLASGDRSVVWWAPDGTRLDVTPDHAWQDADAADGAIVLAGAGWLTWRGDGEPITVEAEEVSRVAVVGGMVAAASVDGEVLVWPDIEAAQVAERTRVPFEPEDLVCDAAGRRVIVAGWFDDDAAAMTVFDVRGDGLVEVVPSTPWPAPAAGVTRPLDDGMLGIATTEGVVLVALDGAVCTAVPVPGIERLTGRGSDVAWIRVSGERERPVIGTARVVGGDLVPGVELGMPGRDRFPHLAVTPAGLTVVAGAGPAALDVYRLTAEERGRAAWSTPARHDLPLRPGR